ncbi:AraC family transcriptional regulator [Larsenimonas rhizosphaerae]|uniref:AraC family transcriptional regulator n=1 Tax=Larsenimonas rhizosphaerae TaxID=2944682 RepID=UPI0020338449|nr:AraC family transcriptional regulator [Larsenimonas rhizosphaerae]MCM2130088.1 AraC family transcriptional regulator [Larsenimonas rhizosphaerae]
MNVRLEDSRPFSQQKALCGMLTSAAGERLGRLETAVPGLYINRQTAPTSPDYLLQTPAFNLMAQGRKTLWAGGVAYSYDPGHYLLASMDIPVLAHVVEASPEAPYLGIRLDIDTALVDDILRDMAALPMHAAKGPDRALSVEPLGPVLLDAICRLAGLLETPEDIPMLAPLYQRELYYRLIQEGQLGWLGRTMQKEHPMPRVARAIALIRRQYDRPLVMGALAAEVHMSVSSLHHHFKAATHMTPLQYQKQLRLCEARYRLWHGPDSVTTIARALGYESASQFSREYRRQFGLSPRQERRGSVAPA